MSHPNSQKKNLHEWTQRSYEIDCNDKDSFGWATFMKACINVHEGVVKWDFLGDFSPQCFMALLFLSTN